MEHQKIEGIAKKIWHIVRVAFFMIRKGICKRKILLDLNMMMKRRKLAGKSLRNLVFHQQQHQSEDYQFSCNLFGKRKPHHFDDAEEVNRVLELMVNDVAASPGLGFGRSPMVRQLRITDSPYPLQNDPAEDSRVNQAAEDFINKFYSQLKQQM